MPKICFACCSSDATVITSAISINGPEPALIRPQLCRLSPTGAVIASAVERATPRALPVEARSPFCCIGPRQQLGLMIVRGQLWCQCAAKSWEETNICQKRPHKFQQIFLVSRVNPYLILKYPGCFCRALKHDNTSSRNIRVCSNATFPHAPLPILVLRCIDQDYKPHFP